MNPLKSLAAAVISRTIPLDLVYYFDGCEIFRETLTASEIKQRGLGVEPFLSRMLSAGMEPTGEMYETGVTDGGAALACPVTKDGHPGLFSLTMQARLPGSA